MSTDYRALCAELHAAVQLYTGQNPASADTPANELVTRLMNALAKTAAALAQPEPVAPTDEELDELYFDNDAGRVASWRQFARAVLARWATP